MANYFNITLDTTAPSNPSITIEGGAVYATNSLVTCAISTGDPDVAGYLMKIWGDVALEWGITNGIIKAGSTTTLEADAEWITFSASKQILLATGESTKTLYCKLMDSVLNESSQVSDSIIVDTTLPIATVISGPDVDRVSKVYGKNLCNFSFQTDSDISAYKVKVVTSNDATEATGTQIGTTYGSLGVGATETLIAGSTVTCVIDSRDLELASTGDGTKIIKVFVRDIMNRWSV